MARNKPTFEEIENIIFHMNYRWKLHSFYFWQGLQSPFSPEGLYEGFEDFLNLKTYESLTSPIFNTPEGKKLHYGFIEHYLQRELMPYEAELRTWMKGAAAHVNGRKIYFRDIIPYCQKDSDREERKILQKETSALCKFLRPFAMSFWEVLLETLRDSFGFKTYMEYCAEKKQLDYEVYCEEIEKVLRATDDLYFAAMEDWSNRRFGVGLEQLNRFDSINMLSLSEFDDLFPSNALEELQRFFLKWNINLEKTSSIVIETNSSPEKSPQAICFVFQVPDEIYVSIKPQSGWMDLEGLAHELGHALFASNMAEDLPFVHKDMSLGNALSEAFAFLIQDLSMSIPFMREQLGVDEQLASMLRRHKVLRDVAVFRRYAARFLSEVEMFSSGDLATGQRYSELMSRYTGFHYQPEACLFDLVPEFYSLDYVLAWMGEASMEFNLREHFGPEWMFCTESVELIRSWWSKGHEDELHGFMVKSGLGKLSSAPLISRWEQALKS